MTTSQSLSRGLSRWAHPLCLRGNGFHGSKKKLIFQVNQCDVSGCLVQCLHLPACLPFLLNKTGNVVSDQAFCVRGGGHPPTGADKNPPLTKPSAHSDVSQYVHTSTWLFIYTTDICSVDLCHADIEVYLQTVIQRKMIICFPQSTTGFLQFLLVESGLSQFLKFQDPDSAHIPK